MGTLVIFKRISRTYWTFCQILQTNLMELLDVSPNSSHGTTGRFAKFFYDPLAVTFILLFFKYIWHLAVRDR